MLQIMEHVTHVTDLERASRVTAIDRVSHADRVLQAM